MQAHMRPTCGRCLTSALQFGNALPKYILGSEKVTAMDCATYDLQDIINDMVDCKEMLRELVVKCHNQAYPRKKFDNYDNGLTCSFDCYDSTDDEMQAIRNILASLEDARTYASGLYNNPNRWELDEMLGRFKNIVRDKLESGFTNRV